MPRTKLSGRKQLREWHEDTATIRYDEDYEITHGRDVITRDYVDPMQKLLDELTPPDADDLASLTIFNETTQKYSGFLSVDGNSSFKSIDLAGSQVDYIIKDGVFTLETENTETAINGGDLGTLTLKINGNQVDTFNLVSNFNEVNRDTFQTYTVDGGGSASFYNSTLNYITIVSIEKYTIGLWQKLVVQLNITSGSLRKGYNTIELTHVGASGGDQTSDLFEVFYDTSEVTPTVTGLSLEVETTTNLKYLSGVAYLGLGDTLKVGASVNAIYDNTYTNSPIYISNMTATNSLLLGFNDDSISGVSTPPAINEVALVNKSLDIEIPNRCTKLATVSVRPSDVFGSYLTVSGDNTILISSFSNTSTPVYEGFDDENYRIPLDFDFNDTSGNITGLWNSEAPLVNGNLQHEIINNNEHGLVYPETNYSGFAPTQSINYTSFSGDQYWVRSLKPTLSKTGITLVLIGLSSGLESLGSGEVNVEIKLPTQTAWIDAILPYDSSIGISNDGDGGLSGSVDYSDGNSTFTVTFGGKATYDSNQIAYLRITYRTSGKSIKSIVTNW